MSLITNVLIGSVSWISAKASRRGLSRRQLNGAFYGPHIKRLIGNLSPKQQKEIAERAARLIGEERTRRDSRYPSSARNRVALSIDEFTEADAAAVRRAEPSVESAAFNNEIESDS